MFKPLTTSWLLITIELWIEGRVITEHESFVVCKVAWSLHDSIVILHDPTTRIVILSITIYNSWYDLSRIVLLLVGP